MTSILIEKYRKQFNKELDKRKYEGVRLDRVHGFYNWVFLVKFRFEKLTDSHCFHEDEAYLNIDAIKKLNQKLFDQNLFHLFNAYFDEYIKLRPLKSKNETKLVFLRNSN